MFLSIKILPRSLVIKSLGASVRLFFSVITTFSTLYTHITQNLIKETPFNLIAWTFKKEGTFYIACKDRNTFSLP